MWWINIIILLFGYLIGSINAAYILGKIKGIDIRKKGSGNAGATNAWRVLGKAYGIITFLFDAGKGIVGFFMALLLTNNSLDTIPTIAYLAAFFAVIGHNFPFYLGKGGKGAATSYGIIIMNLVLLLVYHNLSFQAMLILAFFIISFLIITKAPNITYFTFFIPLSLVINYYSGLNIISISTYLFLGYILIVSIMNVLEKDGIKKESVHMQKKIKIKSWRKALRLLSLIFPLVYFLTTKKITLITVGIILVIFAFVEVLKRVKFSSNNKIMKSLFKKEEKGRVSGVLLFIVSSFLTILLFPKNIALISLIFLIIGDTVAEIIGLKFGTIKLMGEKSLQGSIACFASCFLIGLLIMKVLEFNLFMILAASFAATFMELLPIGTKRYRIDDNFTMPLFTAFVLWLFTIF